MIGTGNIIYNFRPTIKLLVILCSPMNASSLTCAWQQLNVTIGAYVITTNSKQQTTARLEGITAKLKSMQLAFLFTHIQYDCISLQKKTIHNLYKFCFFTMIDTNEPKFSLVLAWYWLLKLKVKRSVFDHYYDVMSSQTQDYFYRVLATI